MSTRTDRGPGYEGTVKWGYFACVGHLCRVVKKVLFLDAKPQEYNFHFRKALLMKIKYPKFTFKKF